MLPFKFTVLILVLLNPDIYFWKHCRSAGFWWEENNPSNYFIINLLESMGPCQDRTRHPWICSQTRICCQTCYRLCYVARYGHVETVSSPNHIFTLGKLNKAFNQFFMHTLWLVTDNNPSWISGRRRMTVEVISWSISKKVWGRAGIELATPGSAVRLATDCATGPGIWLICDLPFPVSYCTVRQRSLGLTRLIRQQRHRVEDHVDVPEPTSWHSVVTLGNKPLPFLMGWYLVAPLKLKQQSTLVHVKLTQPDSEVIKFFVLILAGNFNCS